MSRLAFRLVILIFIGTACAPAPAAPTPTSAPTVVPAAVATNTPLPPPATATSLPPTPTTAPTLVPSPTIALSPTPAAKEVKVTVRNFEFVPRDIKITVGTTVTWVFEQGPHTSTSDDFRTQGPNSWHSGNKNAGESFSFTFKNTGSFRYFCGFHSEPGQPLQPPNMNGLVTVQ